jgi:outer membrane protein assembly factor BamB
VDRAEAEVGRLVKDQVWPQLLELITELMTEASAKLAAEVVTQCEGGQLSLEAMDNLSRVFDEDPTKVSDIEGDTSTWDEMVAGLRTKLEGCPLPSEVGGRLLWAFDEAFAEASRRYQEVVDGLVQAFDEGLADGLEHHNGDDTVSLSSDIGQEGDAVRRADDELRGLKQTLDTHIFPAWEAIPGVRWVTFAPYGTAWGWDTRVVLVRALGPVMLFDATSAARIGEVDLGLGLAPMVSFDDDTMFLAVRKVEPMVAVVALDPHGQVRWQRDFHGFEGGHQIWTAAGNVGVNIVRCSSGDDPNPHRLVTMHRNTGEILWERGVPGPGGIAGFGDRVLHFPFDDLGRRCFQSVDPATGAIRFSRVLDGSPDYVLTNKKFPAVLYVSTKAEFDGKTQLVTAYDTRTGEEFWRHGPYPASLANKGEGNWLGRALVPVKGYAFITGRAGVERIGVDGSRMLLPYERVVGARDDARAVFVADKRRVRLTCLDTETCSPLWQWDSPKRVQQLESGSDGSLAVATDKRLYAFDGADGHVLWETALPDPLDEISVSRRTLIVGRVGQSESPNLFCVAFGDPAAMSGHTELLAKAPSLPARRRRELTR